MSTLSFLIVISCFTAIINGQIWFDYKDEGNNWSDDFPGCGLDNQSPIDITKAETDESDKDRLVFTVLNKKTPDVTLRNTGHAVVAEYVPSGQVPNVQVSFVSTDNETTLLELYQSIFHWGPKDGQGSEHAINGTRYDAEVQCVFFPVKYGTIQDTLIESPKEGTDGNVDIMKNAAQYIDGVREIGNSVVMPGKDGEGLEVLDDLTYNVYVYTGSITRPPCTVGVEWVIVKKIIGVPKAVIEALRKVKLYTGDTSNVRAIQPSSGRKVTDISNEK